MTVIKRKLIILVTISVAACGGWWYLSRPPALEAASLRLSACVEVQDADCVNEFVDTMDRQAYNLDKAKIQLLLSETHKALRRVPGQPIVTTQNKKTIALVQTPYTSTRSNRTVNLGFVVSDTDEGFKAPQFVTQTLLTLSVANVPTTIGKTSAELKLRSWAEYAKSSGPMWEKAGFPGIYRDPTEGMISWSNWQQNCEYRMARLEETLYRMNSSRR